MHLGQSNQSASGRLNVTILSRPFHGLIFKSRLIPALKCWAILISSARRTKPLPPFWARLINHGANMILLPESDPDLLRECEVDTFRSSGPGGQHVNKTESAVRLRHIPSGVVVTSQQHRSQHQNKVLCLQKLRAKIEKLNYRAP